MVTTLTSGETAPSDETAALPVDGGRPITVNVLTGFLGSGKTLLLNRLLQRPHLRRTAVLINEFGDVGIDHLLVESVDDDIILLQSGCICCSIRGDLKDAMVALHGRMHRGEVPEFDRLVIETTGLADPAPIVATLTADPILRFHFRLGNIVTVVDAVDGLHNLDVHPEASRQAAVADRLVISKTDMVDRNQVAGLRRKLASLNPTADILESSDTSDTPASLLLFDVHEPQSKEAEVARWLAAAPANHGRAHDHGDHAHGDVAEQSHRHGTITSFCLTAEDPLEWAVFGLWLSMLLNRHGTNVLRVKGLLNIIDVDAPVVVQGVQHTIHKPEHLSAWPDGDTRTRIVFIVQDIDTKRIERSFRAFHSLANLSGADMQDMATPAR